MADTLYMDASGNVLRPSTPEEAAAYKTLGYAQADDKAIRKDALAQRYGSVWNAVASGVINAVPGLKAGTIGLAGAIGGEAAASNMADSFEGAEAAHPYITGGSQLLAGAGTALAAAALAPVGAAASAVGLGARALAAAPGLAATGAAFGAGNTLDEAAVSYAQTPGGAERLYSELLSGQLLGDLGAGAAKGAGSLLLLGGALGAASGAVGKLAGRAQAASTGLSELATRAEAKATLRNGALADIQALPNGQDIIKFALEKKVLGKSTEKAQDILIREMKRSDGLLNEAVNGTDAAMTLGETIRFGQDLRKQLGGLSQALEAKVNKALAKNPDVRQLRDLRKNLDNDSNFNGGVQSAFQEQVANARSMIDAKIGELFDRAGKPELAKAFAEGNRTYHAAKTLYDATQRAGLTSLAGTAVRVGATAGAAAIGGPAGAALAVGVQLGGGRIPLNIAAKTARGLAFALKRSDGRLAEAVVHSMEGTSGKLAAAELLPTSMYAQVAPVAQHWAQNQSAAISSYVQDLEDRGVPGQVIDATLPQHMAAMQLLAEKIPQNPNAGMLAVPEEWTPSFSEQAKFMEYANAVADPMHAVKEMGAPQREVLERVYPNLLQQVTESVADEAATRPQLPPTGRRWVGQTLGMPARAIDSQTVKQTLAAMAEERKQRMQQMQQAAGSSGSGGGVVGPAPTRVERMSK